MKTKVSHVDAVGLFAISGSAPASSADVYSPVAAFSNVTPFAIDPTVKVVAADDEVAVATRSLFDTVT